MVMWKQGLRQFHLYLSLVYTEKNSSLSFYNVLENVISPLTFFNKLASGKLVYVSGTSHCCCPLDSLWFINVSGTRYWCTQANSHAWAVLIIITEALSILSRKWFSQCPTYQHSFSFSCIPVWCLTRSLQVLAIFNCHSAIIFVPL